MTKMSKCCYISHKKCYKYMEHLKGEKSMLGRRPKSKKYSPFRSALQISLAYIIAGISWILLSDKILYGIGLDGALISKLSVAKGWIYVLVTGILLHLHIMKVLGRIYEADQALIRNHKELIEKDKELKEKVRELTESEERLRVLAYRDVLTNLPNRISFFDTVTNHILKFPHKKKALIFFDIDNFKHINDTLGYLVGDQLIIAIGERLTNLIDDNKSVYRISGDEFVLFIHGYEYQREVESVAQQLIKSIRESYAFANITLNISVSAGIVLYPLHGVDTDTLFKCADIAMSYAKSKNRGGYSFYHETMEATLKERMIISNELRRALDKNEFQLYYQPQLNLETGNICKLEALLRWCNENLGNVPPSKFIEVAEATHIINPIGDWVLNEACRFLKELHNIGYSHIRISINVSAIQLMQVDFVDKIINTLKHYKLDPKYLELEVTESVLIESYENIREKLGLLKSKGISIALDDFGSGYSSLNYLIQMPINTLKIDKSFIHSINQNAQGESLTSMIIMLGKELGLTVVAEGVETKEQVEYLEKFKCHMVQGYYYSKPVPGKEVLNLLNDCPTKS